MFQTPTVSLIGVDTVLGSDLSFPKGWRVIPHLKKDLLWDKAKTVESVIAKGNPNIYLICYSSLDEAESQLVMIARSVRKAAERNKAKIVCFVSSKIFEGCSAEEISEDIEPRPLTEAGRHEFLAEELVLKYPNSLSLRFGEYWSEKHGYVVQMLRRASLGELRVDNKKFSLTSSVLISKAVEIAISRDFVHRYNLADVDFATSALVWGHFRDRLSFRVSERETVEQGVLFSNLRWDTVSMTTSEKWVSLLNSKRETIIRNAIK